ncbi:large conductance mechanosensitive channel protein MscL [Streptomyces sp. VRA16 Mangrove soil]|uniref:large conductance mechanosensitive channel protein MscL n=1 Tax=Streptomyces sp. VRA16 Mangrove soil TaxID=2817434 RepID=UPI001A9F326C|nr:large conductance mechanosensitive channel protein MscL [Streptomyces sp. VRA16 Mangrove soil]MBO1334956.1 large conductance mechanosensitive channel protein MscL [Streptomyces sp. VRA16 Mangrove soil]
MLSGFKDFILRGNIVTMAVGLAIGSAFTALVTAFTTAFITPLLGWATGSIGDYSKAEFTVEGVTFLYGKFINAGIAFLITAAVLYFLIVLPMMKITARADRNKPVDIKAALRDCPRCFSQIPGIATRCAHCTSEVKADEKALEIAGLLPGQR